MPPRDPKPAARSRLEPAPESIKDVMADAIPLFEAEAVIVSETDFQGLLESSEPRGVEAGLRRQAATAAGWAADGHALGVFGSPAASTDVDAELFIVARDAALSRDDDIETRDFFVAAVQLKGKVSWAAVLPRLAVRDVQTSNVSSNASFRSLLTCGRVLGTPRPPGAAAAIFCFTSTGGVLS